MKTPKFEINSLKLLTSKAIAEDVKSYMSYIKCLPNVLDNGRKNSSSSISSAEGSSAASNSGGLNTLV